MSDEVTLGEVRRSLQEHRQTSVEQHRALDERITNLANHTVADTVYQLDKAATTELAKRLEHDRVEGERKVREDVIKPLVDRVTALEKRPALTIGRIAVIAMALIALAGLLVQAYGTLKGAK